MNDEQELQERLGAWDAVVKPVPKPHERRRLSSIPCVAHGLDPDCPCDAEIEVDLDLYHIAVLYPGLIGKALHEFFDRLDQTNPGWDQPGGETRGQELGRLVDEFRQEYPGLLGKLSPEEGDA